MTLRTIQTPEDGGRKQVNVRTISYLQTVHDRIESYKPSRLAKLSSFVHVLAEFPLCIPCA